MAIGLVAIILTGNHVIAIARETKPLSLFSWYQPPEMNNIEGERQTTFRPGDSFVIKYYVERQPISCWAVYTDVISGPVSYQFPETRTQVIVSEVTRVELNLLKVLPDPLPPGEYTWKQVVNPTCEGYELKPFVMDSGIVITILPK